MKKHLIPSVLMIIGLLVWGTAFGSESGSARKKDSGSSTTTESVSMGHEPPPQAYEDCLGKKAGDTVQHTTKEGKVAATCEDSPKGLVARPNRPDGHPPQ
jgi:hypothetical protein